VGLRAGLDVGPSGPMGFESVQFEVLGVVTEIRERIAAGNRTYHGHKTEHIMPTKHYSHQN
jgi:hypothetical protein